MSFLGRKLHGKFEGDIITDLDAEQCRVVRLLPAMPVRVIQPEKQADQMSVDELKTILGK